MDLILDVHVMASDEAGRTELTRTLIPVHAPSRAATASLESSSDAELMAEVARRLAAATEAAEGL